MARSKFVWLIVFDGGETQFIKAQNVWQILDCEDLKAGRDYIINITRMELADNWSYKSATDIPFQD